MTDADLALQAITCLFVMDEEEAVARVVHNTRAVYDSILAKRNDVALTLDEASLLNEKLDRLRARLKFMGQAI